MQVHQPSGFAPTACAKELSVRSQTLHNLLDELRSGKTTLGGRDVVVVDEAGMIGSRQMAELLDQAGAAKAKVVLVGDSRQLQPIDAGGAFRTLSNELGAARLTEIKRQKEEWARENVLSFAMGRSAMALKSFAERGLLTWNSDRQASAERVVGDWAKSRSEEPTASQLMLAGTRAEVAQLNELARQSRLSAGELSKGLAVATSQGGREFSAGDRLLFLRNDKALGVKNGTLGTVESVRARGEFSELRVRTDQGQRVTVTTEQYNYIDHGYATTVHKAQGQTVDRAYVLLGRMHDRELSYVSASRARGAWLAVRGTVSAPELFVNAERTAMTRAGFEYILDKHVSSASKTCDAFAWTLCIAPSASTQLRAHDAASHSGHPQSGTVARPRRYPHHRDLPARGSIGEARSSRSGSATRPAPRALQGAGRADRFTLRAGIMRSAKSLIGRPRRRFRGVASHNPALRIMQSIFSSAARRTIPVACRNAERRGGELKMDWTEPPPCTTDRGYGF